MNKTGFIVINKILDLICDFKAINERLCYIRLRTKVRPISIICAYALTNVANDVEKEAFYDNLKDFFNIIPSYDTRIAVGDFNAKVGKESVFEPTIGKHSLHDESSDNGIRLINFAASQNMVICSSLF